MSKMTNEIFKQMQEQFNGCPLFIDREKGDLDDLIGQKVKIESYYELTGENGAYYAVAFVGDDKKFYLSGGDLTNLIKDYGDCAKEVEVLIMEKVKTKNHRDFRPIRVL